MARTAKSPQQRAFDVEDAASKLPALLKAAGEALNAYGPTDRRTLEAWEAVETEGATIHRQARLLAGKSRGG